MFGGRIWLGVWLGAGMTLTRERQAGEWKARVPHAAAVFGCALALAFAPAGNPAAAQDVFEVSGVAVDVTAETAAAARARALASGEQRAFEILLDRLTLKSDIDRLPVLSAADRAELVQDLSVANEKTSAVRYLAELTFRFKPREVRRLLRDLAIDFAETPSKPVLVLPVYRAAGVVVLWDDPNPWRDAWSGIGGADGLAGLVPMEFPAGGLADIAVIGAAQAAAGDRARLKALSGRYGTSDVIVALAELAAAPGGAPSISVTVNRYGESVSEQAIVSGVTGRPGEAVEAVLRRAAAQVADEIEDQWKADNLIQFERSEIVAVVLPITSLGDWVTARSRLRGVAVVDRIDLVLLSRDEARLNIRYLGDIGQLALALAQADLGLREEGGSWILELGSGAAPRPPTPPNQG